ncbi:hypothetical protein BACI9J_860003 [Bacillus altitudinis]|nr:hypothetical protein BACI9J_860003 [Bacillus altitudinis]
MLLREALDVHLVHDGVGERGPQQAVAVPVEGPVGDDRLGHRAGRVGVVELLGVVHVVAEQGLAPLVGAVDSGGVGVEQELRAVVAEAVRRVPRAVHAEAVAGADGHAGHDVVEGVAGAVAELGAVLGAVVVEGAELDALGGAREQGDVGAPVDERDAERGARGSGHAALLPAGRCATGSLAVPLAAQRTGGTSCSSNRSTRSPSTASGSSSHCTCSPSDAAMLRLARSTGSRSVRIRPLAWSASMSTASSARSRAKRSRMKSRVAGWPSCTASAARVVYSCTSPGTARLRDALSRMSPIADFIRSGAPCSRTSCSR